MSNFKKSFSFRNGVQVDTDNFVVTSAGLVGIGTTIPREYFHVFGDSKFEDNVNIGTLDVVGVSTFQDLVHVGSSITMYPSTGIISATAFYGNGATLLNLPTSQWQDVDPGLGFTSIYAVGNVGVGTDDPTGNYVFQVGSDPSTVDNLPGVGIGSDGHAYFSGIVTSTSGFIGGPSEVESLTIDSDGSQAENSALIVGNDKTRIRSDEGSYYGQGNIVLGVNYPATSTGITLTPTGDGSFANDVTVDGDLDVDGRTELDITNISETLNVVGVSTFNSDVHISNDLAVTGVSTFTGNAYFSSPIITDTITATNVTVRPGNVNVLDGNVYFSTTDKEVGWIDGNGILRVLDTGSSLSITGGNPGENMGVFTQGGSVDLYYNNSKKLGTTETGASITGSLTVSDDIIVVDKVGIGTTNAQSDLQISRDNAVRVDLVSTSSGSATFSIGNELGGGNDRGAIVYDNSTLYLNNYDVGGIIVNLHEGSGAGTTENFAVRHLNQEILSVSAERKVGINKPLPEKELDVAGDVYVSGSSRFVGIVTIGEGENTFTFGDGSPLPIPQTQNFNTQSGLSTFFGLDILGQVSFAQTVTSTANVFIDSDFIGIRTENTHGFNVRTDGDLFAYEGLVAKNKLMLTKDDNGEFLSDPRPLAEGPFADTVPYLDYGDFQVQSGASSIVGTQLIIVPYPGKQSPGYGTTYFGVEPDSNTGYLSMVGVNTYFPRSTFDIGVASTATNNYIIPPSCTQDEIDIMVDLWDGVTHPQNTNVTAIKRLTPDGIVPGALLYNKTSGQMEVGIKPREFAPLGVPIGGIIMWYGAINTIPSGYALCDGTNGTPDLRDKFVIGAGDTYTPGDTANLGTTGSGVAYALAYIMRTNA